MTKIRKEAPAAAPVASIAPHAATRCAAALATLHHDTAGLLSAVMHCRAVVEVLPAACDSVDHSRGAREWAAGMDRVQGLAGAAGVLLLEVLRKSDALDQHSHEAAQRMNEALDEAAGVMRAMLHEAEAGGAHLAAAGLARQWLRTHTGQDEPRRFDPAEDEAAFIVGMPASSRAPAQASAGKGA